MSKKKKHEKTHSQNTDYETHKKNNSNNKIDKIMHL